MAKNCDDLELVVCSIKEERSEADAAAIAAYFKEMPFHDSDDEDGNQKDGHDAVAEEPKQFLSENAVFHLLAVLFIGGSVIVFGLIFHFIYELLGF